MTVTREEECKYAQNAAVKAPKKAGFSASFQESLQPPAIPTTYRPMEPQIPRENHPHPCVSVIIPAMNEAGKISAVIAEARAVHPETEVIVVANGCKDQTAAVAERMGAKVLSYAEPLGHDVGRSVGAEAAKGRILLLQTAIWLFPPVS